MEVDLLTSAKIFDSNKYSLNTLCTNMNYVRPCTILLKVFLP